MDRIGLCHNCCIFDWRSMIGRLGAVVFSLLIFTVATSLASAQMTTESADALTVETVTSTIARAETAPDLTDEVRAKVLERLRSAQAELKRRDDATLSAERFQNDAATAAERAAEFRKELEKIQHAAPGKPSADQTLQTLEADLANHQATLSTWKSKQKELEAEVKSRPERQAELRKEQSQADVRRSDIKKLSDLLGTETEAPALVQARKTEADAKLRAFEQSVTAIQNELFKYSAEDAVGILDLRVKLNQARINAEELAIHDLTEEVSRRRREEADRAIRAARRQVMLAHPLLKPFAEQNRIDTEELRRLSTTIEGVDRSAEQVQDQLDRLRTLRDQTEEKIESIGLTRPIGLLLRAQRSDFPDLKDRTKAQATRQELIEQARLHWWDYTEKGKLVQSPAELVRDVSGDSQLTAEERLDLERSAADRLTERKQVLTGLERASKQYFDRLVELASLEQRYLNESDRYLDFINENILWTRSAEPLTWSVVRNDNDTREWLFAPEHWQTLVTAVSADPVENPMAFWPTLIAIAAFLYARMRIKPRLRWLGEKAGKRGFLRFSPTGQAAMLTVVAAAMAPVSILLISWRLAERTEPSGFVNAVSVSLQWVALFLFPVELMREACRAQGLAEMHFNWSHRLIREIRRTLAWLKLTGAPLLLLGGLAHHNAPLAGGSALERLVFIGGMIVGCCLLYRLMASQSEMTKTLATENPQGPYVRFRPIWLWGSLLIPASLAALSGAGYHYTGTQLADRLLRTLWLVPTLIIIRALCVRWLLLSRRRVLLDQAYQRRAAEEAADGVTKIALPPETDVARSTSQSRRLIEIVLLGVAATGLWMIWADVLPAFNHLNREVWSTGTETVVETAKDNGIAGIPGTSSPPSRVSSAGKPKSIKTLDLLLAVCLAVFTFIASRNLPGLLEMAVLTRLPVDNATRYAATRLASYAIIAIGILMSAQKIGMSWSNVQWLAAALTVGLGFGLQEVFANFVSGLIILFERPIRVGDIVTIDEVTGTVSRIRMRATTITNWDRKEFIVPNKEFITGRLLNWTLSDSVNRITIEVGVSYSSDPEQARQLLLKIAAEHPIILKDPPPIASFEKFGDSSLNLVLRCYLPALEHRLPVTTELHCSIKRSFDAVGIEFPFPQRTVHIRRDANDLSGESWIRLLESDDPFLDATQRSNRSEKSVEAA